MENATPVSKVIHRPCRTLYIQNLNTKINKVETTRLLYSFFTQFGSVLDVCVSRHPKHRGQAYVSFRELTTSATALRASHNYPLAEKPMRCAYAKRDSDAVLEYLGIGNAMLRKKGRLDKIRKETKQQKAAKKAKLAEEKAHPPVQLMTEMAEEAAAKESAQQAEKPTDLDKEKEKQENLVKTALRGNPNNPPNYVLFLENLPEESSKIMIDVLFNQFDGYKEVRMVEDQKSIGFVEFDTADNAQKAKESLHLFEVTPGKPMTITFGSL